MGVVRARCTKCERTAMVIVYQQRGRRLRNQRSRCCGARYQREWSKLYQKPAGATVRP